MESVVYLLAAMFFQVWNRHEAASNAYAQRYALEWSKLVSKDAVVEMPQDEHEEVSAARHAALSQPLGTDAIELREIQKVVACGMPASELGFRFMMMAPQ